MLFAEGGEFDDLVFGEDSAHRVLRVAEYEEFCTWGDFGLHGFPVEGPLAIDFDMVGGEEFHGGVMVNAKEGRVGGGAGEEGVAGFSKGAGGEGEGGDEAAEVDDFFFGRGVADAGLEVALEGFDEGGVGDGVAKDAVIDALPNDGDDFGRGGEVHVGNPEGVEVGAAVPLERAGGAAGEGGVEIGHERMMAEMEEGPITKLTKVRKAGDVAEGSSARCVGEFRKRELSATGLGSGSFWLRG